MTNWNNEVAARLLHYIATLGLDGDHLSREDVRAALLHIGTQAAEIDRLRDALTPFGTVVMRRFNNPDGSVTLALQEHPPIEAYLAAADALHGPATDLLVRAIAGPTYVSPEHKMIVEEMERQGFASRAARGEAQR